jgi:hypothetical protein
MDDLVKSIKSLNTGYPAGATPVISASGIVANSAAGATLPGVAGKTTYITGFEITGSGAAAGLPVAVSLVGTGATLTYAYSAAAGVLVENTPLLIPFLPPLPASAANTPISVSVPALGTGNTSSTVVAHGFQL